MKDARYHREALVVSKAVKYSLGEARSLAQLGKPEEALTILSAGGTIYAAERGRLLLKLKRHREAAKAFEEANDYLGRARATELIDRDSARRLYEDSAGRIELTLKHELIPRLKVAKKRLKEAEAAKNSLAIERARIYYAQFLGQVGQAYRNWSASFEGAGDKGKAVKSARKAISFFRTQRSRLTDGGGDAFGKKAVEVLGVAKALSEAEAALARCESLPE